MWCSRWIASRKVPNSPSNFAAYTKPVASTEVVDPHTIRLHTNGVFPLLPTYLAQFVIINRKTDEGMATEDFNSGKAAIGTGPFRFVSYKPGDRIELDRNDGYWGQKPPWQHVDYRFIANDASRTAALLAGDVDFIDFVPTEDLEKLRKDPHVRLWEALGLRLIFLGLDQSRDGPSPFVFGPQRREAGQEPAEGPTRAAGTVDRDQSPGDRRPGDGRRGDADPASICRRAFTAMRRTSSRRRMIRAEAKKLLAEAGYPDGLRIALHGPNDRYVNDAEIIQAVGQMWTRIGVQTEVDPLPWTSFVGQANKQAFSAFLFGWGSGTAEPSDPLIAQNATFDPAKGWGAANRGRYSNPELDKLIAQALGTADDAAREKLLQQAQKIVFDDVALIPLHIQKNIWATRAGFTYVPTVGEDAAPGQRPRSEVMQRCTWAEGGDAAMLAYHDTEWGVPQHDDRALFELLTLEGAQAGLSWRTVLARRDDTAARIMVSTSGELPECVTPSWRNCWWHRA